MTGFSHFTCNHNAISWVWNSMTRSANATIKETTKLTDLPSLITDRCHSIFGHMPIIQKHACFTSTTCVYCCWLEVSTGSLMDNLAPAGGIRQYLSEPVSSQVLTAHCGDRHDPQLVDIVVSKWIYIAKNKWLISVYFKQHQKVSIP